MLRTRKFKIAGPLDDERTGDQVERARTQLFVRDRVQDAVRQARHPRDRRTAKGAGRWSPGLSAEL